MADPRGSSTDPAPRSAQRAPRAHPTGLGGGGAAPWVGPVCLETSIVLFSYDETNTCNGRKFRTHRKA